MPTSTFFRLPEEKRERLLRAARDEFTRVPFAEASINRIIAAARIPRGSFYQYFRDKNDLFGFVINQVRQSILKLFEEIREKTRGDIFELPLYALDAFCEQDGSIAPRFADEFAMLQLNRSMDIAAVLIKQSDEVCCSHQFLQRWDRTMLRCEDDDFVNALFAMIANALGSAIAHIMADPSSRRRESERLALCVDIMRNGSMKKGETR